PCSPLLDETRPLHSEAFREKMVQLVSVCRGKLNSLFRAERDFICDLRFGFAPFSTSPSLLAPTRLAESARDPKGGHHLLTQLLPDLRSEELWRAELRECVRRPSSATRGEGVGGDGAPALQVDRLLQDIAQPRPARDHDTDKARVRRWEQRHLGRSA